MSKTFNVQRSVLGTLITYPERLHRIDRGLVPEMFDPQFKGLVEFFGTAKGDHNLVDPNILRDKFGSSFIDQLVLTSNPVSFFKQYENIIEDYKHNEIQRLLSESLTRLTSEKTDEVIVPMLKDIDALNHGTGLGDKSLKDMAVERYELAKMLRESGLPLGLTTSFAGVNDMLRGWLPGKYILLAARPHLGKTTLGLGFLLDVACRKPVAFLSLEMTAADITDEIIMMLTGLPPEKIKNPVELSDQEFDRWRIANNLIDKLQITIVDNSILRGRLDRIEEKVHSLIATKNIEMFGLDYLQLVQPPTGYTDGNYSMQSISRTISTLCKSTNVPGLILSQLNRAVEHRTDRRPRKSDLRDSGSLEQDADIILFLYRDDYYYEHEDGQYTADFGNYEPLPVGVMEVNIDKNRGVKKLGKIHFNLVDNKIREYHLDNRPPMPTVADDPQPVADNNLIKAGTHKNADDEDVEIPWWND